MTWLPDKAAQRLKDNPQALKWMEGLSRQVEHLQEKWQLDKLEVLPAGLGKTTVLACRQDKKDCILKLAYDIERLALEHQSLVAWGGIYVPQIYETAEGAYLMERALPGSIWQGKTQDIVPLIEHFSMSSLPDNMQHIITAHQQAFDRLQNYNQKLTDKKLADECQKACYKLQSLPEPGQHHLVHTDLHPYNLLAGAHGAFAIDPMMARGHFVYDAGAFAAKNNPLQIEERIRVFSNHWPQYSDYIIAISQIIAVEEAAVATIYSLRSQEEITSSLQLAERLG